MNPYALAGGLLALIAAFGGGWWTGGQVEQAAQAREDRVAAVATEAAASSAADAISRIKVQHRTVQQEIQREVVEKPVFRDCRSGPNAVRLFNSTIPGYKPELAGSGVPAADALAR